MRQVCFTGVLALAFAGGLSLPSTTAFAQPDPSGIAFVTVGAPGNPAYHGPDPDGIATGRGRVDYEYRIGKTEVTAGQWDEFFRAAHAAEAAGGAIPYLGSGIFWSSNPNGLVSGITWRTSAIFCNWLHNGKGTSRSSFMSGAYDVSTFGDDPTFSFFTDQAARSPGAKYFIPTLDEWIKAAHYDPNKDGVGGYWLYPTTSDTRPLYGPPPGFPGGSPVNQANTGFGLPGFGEFKIPLGSYPSVTSPWGLLDASGGTSEWTETIFSIPGVGSQRLIDGSHVGDISAGGDRVWGIGGGNPWESSVNYGFRVAAVVPGISSSGLLFAAVSIAGRRARPVIGGVT